MADEGIAQGVERLLREGNYIGAYSRVRALPESDPLRSELSGRVANAVASELQASRSAGSERVAYLRAQLAWVCRDIPGLSYLYREQLRQREGGGNELLRSIQDLASGRTDEVADRVRRNVEGVQESIASGEAQDRIQSFLKDAERNLRDGAKQVGSFLDSVVKRGQSIRAENENRASDRTRPRDQDAPPREETRGAEDGSVKIPINGDEDPPKSGD